MKGLCPRRNSNHIFEWSLRPCGEPPLFLTPIIAFSLVVVPWERFVVARVTYQIDTVSIPDIQKALQQDPGQCRFDPSLGIGLRL